MGRVAIAGQREEGDGILCPPMPTCCPSQAFAGLVSTSYLQKQSLIELKHVNAKSPWSKSHILGRREAPRHWPGEVSVFLPLTCFLYLWLCCFLCFLWCRRLLRSCSRLLLRTILASSLRCVSRRAFWLKAHTFHAHKHERCC